MACPDGFWYEEDTLDISLCAQDLFLAPASLAAGVVTAVLFVLASRSATRQRALREPLIDAYAINDASHEDQSDRATHQSDRLQCRWLTSWLTFGCFITLPILDATASLITIGHSTRAADLTRRLVGDGSHALGWLPAL